jgi:hypothetical protein
MTETLPVRASSLPAVTAPPSPTEWNAMRQQADVIVRSGMAPKSVNTPEKVLTIALKGRELQIPPMQALSHIHIVEGKPTLSAELMAALVQRAGHKLRVLETNDERCVVEGERRDDPGHPQRLEFTIEEAEQAGVARKQVWRSYPAAMLRARAISALCRFAFADVLMGASYTPEELGADVDEGGAVIDAETLDHTQPEAEIEGETEPEVTPEHEAMLVELRRILARIPDEKMADKERAVEWATESEQNAGKVLRRAQQLFERHVEEEREKETGDGTPEDLEGPIRGEQHELLVELADEVYKGRHDFLDGHEYLQREIGRPFEELSAKEAYALIRKLEERKRGKEETA